MAKVYIECEDALKGLEDSDIGFCDDEPIQTRNSALKIIQNIPAADVAPVRHGRWKKSYADHEAFGVRPFFRYCSERICGRRKMINHTDRILVIALALACAVLSVAFNTERHGRIADAFLIAAYIIVGSAIVIWRTAG